MLASKSISPVAGLRARLSELGHRISSYCRPAVAGSHRRQHLRDSRGPQRSGHTGSCLEPGQHGSADDLSSRLRQAGLLFLSQSSCRPLRSHHLGHRIHDPTKDESDRGHRLCPPSGCHSLSRHAIGRCDGHERSGRGGRYHCDPSGRGRIRRADDRAAVERKKLYGSAGDSTGSGADLDPVAELGHHGRRHREPRSVGRSESRQPVHQRPARVVQWLHGERHRCAGAHERRHLHHSQPRFDRRVSGTDQQLRS